MSSVASALPLAASALPTTSAVTAVESSRFTLDGDSALEARLAQICELVRDGVEEIVPPDHLEGVLLGGGYGRGEGGVARTPGGDQPYNDLEFYVFVRGNILLNRRRYDAALAELGHQLSETAGIEVEFKLDSLTRLRRGGVTMFSYDLVKGHRRVSGAADLLRGCEHHERAAEIPLAEAARLLMNRCSGLLFAAERLGRAPVTPADLDFVARNVAKARLALGDAVLVACREYHWSCRERHQRLATLASMENLPWLATVRVEHARGVAFKLHPTRDDRTEAQLREEHRQVSQLAQRVWLWLESRRLGKAFASPVDYALDPAPKCPETSAWRNGLINMRRFGPGMVFEASFLRYPRERLLRALPVLLWQPAQLAQRPVTLCLQSELRTEATSPQDLLAAYVRLWETYR